MKRLLTPLFLGLAVVGLHADDNAAGKAAYATCQVCHGADGTGTPAGAKKMGASLAGSKIALGDPSVMALVVMKGIKKEGDTYLLPMAPLEATLKDDAKFAAVLTYVRQSFGNKASAVTAADVAGYRTKWKEQKEPVTRAKLEELNKK